MATGDGRRRQSHTHKREPVNSMAAMRTQSGVVAACMHGVHSVPSVTAEIYQVVQFYVSRSM